MNKKAYLRGIGAGMIVAAIVMGVSSNKPMTDAEILSRAKEIEASESTVLTEISEEKEGIIKEIPVKDSESSVSAGTTSVSTEKDITSNETGASADKAEAAGTDDNRESESSTSVSIEETGADETKENPSTETTVSVEEKPEQSEVKEPEKINPMPEGETGFTNNEGSVEIQIIRGDSSVSVSRRMYEAGLVESAVEFDRFLCANGYDKSISVGTYEIPYGLEFEEMAKIIARRK